MGHSGQDEVTRIGHVDRGLQRRIAILSVGTIEQLRQADFSGTPLLKQQRGIGIGPSVSVCGDFGRFARTGFQHACSFEVFLRFQFAGFLKQEGTTKCRSEFQAENKNRQEKIVPHADVKDKGPVGQTTGFPWSR